MSTSSTRAAEDAILDSIDSYTQTQESMCAFAQVLEKHYGAESRIAPAMRPSHSGGSRAGGAVTPDMVSQGRGINLVIEAKRSLPSGEGGRAAVLAQLGRYDGDLDGWRRNPPTHDIVLMTHMSKSAQWADFLKDALKKKKASFDRKVSVVGYVRDSERATYMILKNEWGSTSNAELNRRLHDGIVVRGRDYIKKMNSAMFSDSKPHVAYTMGILWEDFFLPLAARGGQPGPIGQKPGGPAVDLPEIMDAMRRPAVPFSCAPKQAWVAEALDALVGLKMLRRLPDGRFLVHGRPAGDDNLGFFVRELARAGSRQGEGA